MNYHKSTIRKDNGVKAGATRTKGTRIIATTLINLNLRQQANP